MKDKVYIHRTIHLGLLSGTEIPVGAPDEEEYIRKGALLGWIERQFSSLMEPDTQAFIDELEEFIESL